MPSTLQSGLLEDTRAPQKERRFLSSFSAQGLAIIAVQLFSLAVVVTVLQQHQDPTVGGMNLRPQGGVTDLVVPNDLATTGVGLPHKFAIEHVTPVQFQWQRGTCWDFTIIALLEHSYRLNGIRKGWLQPDTYVKFSQQALGAQLMRFCRNGHSKFCMSPGDDLWKGNTTEGAEVELLYYVEELGNMALPHSVCPYTKEGGNDGVCDGMDEARKVNPVQFKVKHMKTFYDRIKIKEHLSKHGLAMGISATLVGSHFYLPCMKEFTSKPGMYQRACKGDGSCVQCPADHAYHSLECCAKIERPGYNMEGEFFSRDPSIDGGHAMTIVGYNDIFRTTTGDVGGWIVKNSWWDGKSSDTTTWQHARGSHSMAYFMLESSDTDERAVCPNSYNPRNWYPCAGQNGVTSDGKKKGPAPSHYSFEHMVSICTNDVTKLVAQNQRRVLQLTCQNPDYCDTDGSQLYLINSTYLAGGLDRMCFLQQSFDKSLKDFCLPPLLVDDVAMFITPADHEVKENDRDLCGFYFFPYKLLESTTSMIGASTYDIQGFDIDWSPSSYDRGHLNAPGLDYSELRRSTRKQRERRFSGDLPNQDSRQ